MLAQIYPTASAKSTRKFAAGLLPTAPHFRVTDHTVSDAQWLLADEVSRMEAADAREQALLDWEMEQAAGEAAYHASTSFLDERDLKGGTRV